MKTQFFDILTADGICDSFAAWPDGQNGKHSFPAVLLYMDAYGPREYLYDMAKELAGHGYYVLLPNFFYRSRKAPVIDLKFPLKPEMMGEARTQIMGLYHSYSPEQCMKDTEAFLNFLDSQEQVQKGKVSITGYCMGGSMGIRAAAVFPDKIGAVASFHAGMLASDDPKSPHRLLPEIRARLYVAHADQDQSMPAEQIERFEKALKESGLDAEAETYVGAHHGFTMKDLPAYHPSALEKHWKKLIPFLAK